MEETIIGCANRASVNLIIQEMSDEPNQVWSGAHMSLHRKDLLIIPRIHLLLDLFDV